MLAVFGAALGLVPPWQVVSVELPRQGRWLPLRAANDEQLAVARRQHHLAAGPARQPLPRFQTGPRPQTRRSLPATHPPIVPEPPPRTATPNRHPVPQPEAQPGEGWRRGRQPTVQAASSAPTSGHSAHGGCGARRRPSRSRPATQRGRPVNLPARPESPGTGDQRRRSTRCGTPHTAGASVAVPAASPPDRSARGPGEPGRPRRRCLARLREEAAEAPVGPPHHL